jgi:hypothetical protein
MVVWGKNLTVLRIFNMEVFFFQRQSFYKRLWVEKGQLNVFLLLCSSMRPTRLGIENVNKLRGKKCVILLNYFFIFEFFYNPEMSAFSG